MEFSFVWALELNLVVAQGFVNGFHKLVLHRLDRKPPLLLRVAVALGDGAVAAAEHHAAVAEVSEFNGRDVQVVGTGVVVPVIERMTALAVVHAHTQGVALVSAATRCNILHRERNAERLAELDFNPFTKSLHLLVEVAFLVHFNVDFHNSHSLTSFYPRQHHRGTPLNVGSSFSSIRNRDGVITHVESSGGLERKGSLTAPFV